jgi:hypothetical protein
MPSLGLGTVSTFGCPGADKIALNIGQAAEYRQHRALGAGARVSRRSTGDVTPCAKGGIASRTMLIGAEVMTAELEMVVDPAVGGEETLRVTR